MVDVIATAIGEFLLSWLPDSRRGRIILAVFMVASLALGLAVLVVVLSG
jgi:hypothetical protein